MKEEYDKAQGNFQIALDHALALGEKWGAAGCYHKLGQVARARGNYPLALQIFQDGLELLKKVDDPRRTGFILRELGGVARVQGEHSASWEYYRESLQIAKKIGAEALALETLTGVASLLAETGEPERGVALLTLALTHPASEQLTQNRAAQTLQILHERGTKDTVTQEHGKGRSQPLEETIESILGNSIVSRSNEHAMANSGSWFNANPFTDTLGGGSWAGNMTSENVNYKHFMNYTWLSVPFPEYVPTDEDLFGDYFARWGRD